MSYKVCLRSEAEVEKGLKVFVIDCHEFHPMASGKLIRLEDGYETVAYVPTDNIAAVFLTEDKDAQ